MGILRQVGYLPLPTDLSTSTVVTKSNFCKKFVGKNDPFSVVSSVSKYTVQLTQKSLLNQAAFCLSSWPI